jgi:putative ABC transport system permease protein
MGHVQDLRFAARAFARGRSTTALAVAAFALGIGATTAVFSIFNSVLLAPLPYPDAHQLVLVYDTQPACDTCPASFPKYHDWREHNRVFSAIGGSTPWGAVLTGSGDPERVAGVAVTASLVDVLGWVLHSVGGFRRRRINRPGREWWSSAMASGSGASAALPASWANR